MSTNGFDLASPQAGINVAEIRGVSFALVKATGANVGIYVAPHYVEQLEACRRAGFHVGHTHLTGKAGTPAEQADYFVSHLEGFDVDHDTLQLDNELFPEEPGSVMFSDAETAEFWARVFERLPRFPRHHAFTYGGLWALSRHDWPATNALGIRWWVADYDTVRGARGALPAFPHGQVAIHQWTSSGNLGGRTVDLDWSPLSVEDLFGAAATAAVKAHQALAVAQAKTRAAAAKPVPQSSTARTGNPGNPGSPFWMRMQLLAREGGYAGVIDGRLAVNSWKGLQTYLAKHYGYRGLVDGQPGPLTEEALQRLAAAHGYRGPVDGKPGAETWRAIALCVNGLAS